MSAFTKHMHKTIKPSIKSFNNKYYKNADYTIPFSIKKK